MRLLGLVLGHDDEQRAGDAGLQQGTSWVHLRICLTCGYVGCCDSSPYRHARAHAHADDHPLIASAEPGETWAHCFADDVTVEAPGDVPRARALPPA